MKKALIFDFDYTLGDSTEGIIACVRYAFQKMNLPEVDTEQIKKSIGLSLPKTYEFLSGRTSATEGDLFQTYFKEKSDEVMVINTSLYDGVIDLLTNLHRKGYKIGIVTTKYNYRIRQILEAHGISHLVDEIVGGNDVSNMKPDPEGLNLIAKNLGLEPKDILYIGDSIVDSKASMAAEIDFCGVLTGTTSQSDFELYPYVKILPSVRKLNTIL